MTESGRIGLRGPGLLALGGTSAAARAGESMFRTATDGAGAIAEIGVVLFVGAALIFVGVMALVAMALWGRGRAAQPVSARRWVVGGGIVFPVVVLSALLLYSTVRSGELTPTHAQPGRVIGVEAHMWWWSVRYRHPAGGPDIVLANEIRVPVGERVTLGLTTADVIHSFWVPPLAGKVDMVPGRVHQLPLKANRAGVFRGQCAEYCGTQHAKMALQVVAMPRDEFERWLEAQARPAREPQDALAQRGREVFLAQRCNACHTVRGVAEGGRLAPDLTHVGSRLSIGAGSLPTHAGTLGGWVANTQRVKPGVRMPSFGHLDGASLHALATYLAQLR